MRLASSVADSCTRQFLLVTAVPTSSRQRKNRLSRGDLCFELFDFDVQFEYVGKFHEFHFVFSSV